MRPRVRLANFILRLGSFIYSLAIMIMRPDDLVAFCRVAYSKKSTIDDWGKEDLVNLGLNQDEKELLENLPISKGRMLVLGLGGGREAIPLAKMGFQVTGVDFIPEMVERAKENALRCGTEIEGMVQDISKLDFPDDSFDAVWLSSGMYSCVPTRARRIEMLKSIGKILKPGSCFLCQFQMAGEEFSGRINVLRKIFAVMTLGNLSFEKGDLLWGNRGFMHTFCSEKEIKSEFEAGGFETLYFNIPKGRSQGGAVLRRFALTKTD